MISTEKLGADKVPAKETEDYIIEGPPLLQNFGLILPLLYSTLIKHQDKTFLIDGYDGRKWSFKELLVKARAWASWLRSRGIGEGHIVSIAAHKDIDSFAVCVGTWLSGAAANPFNFTTTSDDIRRMLGVTTPDVVYCSAGETQVLAALKDMDAVIVRPGGCHPHLDSRQILAQDDPCYTPSEDFHTSSHVFHINFSSGTTGTPKAVLFKDSGFPIRWKKYLDQTSPIFQNMPIFGPRTFFTTNVCIMTGRPLLVEKPNCSTEYLLSLVQRFQPSMWFALGSTMLELSKHCWADKYDLHSLEIVTCGGDFMSAAQKRRINKDVFGGRLVIKNAYGATEVGSVAIWMDDLDPRSVQYESSGNLSRGVSLKIIDENGCSLRSNQFGEILVKTSWPTAGLMTTGRKKVSHVDQQGWYHTGDVGYFDDHKFLYPLGRCENVFTCRGKKVLPGLMDTVIRRHSDVFESATVVKETELGDVPVVFIVLRQGSSTTKEEMQQYISENLEEFQRPQEIHIVESLPSNARGKIIRSELKKLVNSYPDNKLVEAVS